MTITSDSRVRDILAEHPATGEIFIQLGSFFRTVPGEQCAVCDPDLTVETFAARNAATVAPLLARLVAVAEADDLAPPAREEGALEQLVEQCLGLGPCLGEGRRSLCLRLQRGSGVRRWAWRAGGATVFHVKRCFSRAPAARPRGCGV
jgi:hypothetical protein